MEAKWSVESWLGPLFLWVPDTILWLRLHFWSEQLEQTSSATGSPHMPRKQGVVCFSAVGKTIWRGLAHVVPKAQVCFVPFRVKAEQLSCKLLCGHYLVSKNGLGSALGHQDKSFQQGRTQATIKFQLLVENPDSCSRYNMQL